MNATSFAPGRYYKHSGRFSTGGALRAMLFGLLVGVPTAWLYAWLIHWNPFVYISFLATLGFGALVGAATETFLESGKCRNVFIAALVTFVVMLVSYYVSWVVWGVEAAVLFGIALYLAVTTMQRATFCEGCERATTTKEGVCFVAAGATPDLEDKNAVKACVAGLKQHAADLKQRLEAKNFSFLEHLGPVPEAAFAWYRVDLNVCEKCDKNNTMRVVRFQKKLEGGKVKDDTEDKEVLRQLILSSSEAGSVKALGEKLVPLMPKLAEARAKSSGADKEKSAGT